MKKRSSKIIIFFAVAVIFTGCKSTVDNSLTIKNIAAASVIVNFRGSTITVAAGATSVIKEIPKGTYSYATTYQVPSGTASSSAQGDVTGDVVIKAGTRILILFSSTFDSSSGGYVLYATISNSDDQTAGTVTGP